MTRSRAIAAKCRECLHDQSAAGTWREQIAACACTLCPLWAYRPLPRTPPACIASKNPADLPQGFRGLSHDEAIGLVRASGARVEAHRGAYTQRPCPAPLSLEVVP